MRVRRAEAEERERLLELWERSVRATHHFLQDRDILELRPLVGDALASDALEWWVLVSSADSAVGFLGFADDTIEALFIDPEHQGRGGGKLLVTNAQSLATGALKVDVNEQNEAAVRFYQALGFRVTGRSPTDSGGRPFPILHLTRTAAIPLEIPLIQVAGIRDLAEAELLQECGIHYLGFPLRLDVHQEDLSEEAAADIVRGLRPPARGVLITYLNEAKTIAEFCQAMGARIVQLHGDVSRTELERLRELDPTLTIIKSLVVGRHSPAVLERFVVELAPLVDGFITDTYAPETGASGATGRTHDWTVSRRLVALSPKPVILAGGLTPSNVREAIAAVRPAGVDVHTGVEDAGGRKDREKVLAFVAEAKAGFLDCSG